MNKLFAVLALAGLLSGCHSKSDTTAETLPDTDHPADSTLIKQPADEVSRPGTEVDTTGSVPAGATYVCPMGCEGSASDKPGKCPTCGMDLEKAS